MAVLSCMLRSKLKACCFHHRVVSVFAVLNFACPVMGTAVSQGYLIVHMFLPALLLCLRQFLADNAWYLLTCFAIGFSIDICCTASAKAHVPFDYVHHTTMHCTSTCSWGEYAYLVCPGILLMEPVWTTCMRGCMCHTL